MSTVSGLVKSTPRWMPEFRITQSRSEFDVVMLQNISGYAVELDVVKQTWLQNPESWRSH